ncbi:MAG: GNAT family N-acetyltransferase [Clostridia bacterium]
MIEIVAKEVLSDVEKDGIREVLFACSDEFFPPLSQRNSSVLSDMKGALISEEKPYSYLAEMLKQKFILAKKDEKVVGFMTFKEKYSCDALKSVENSTYITTICVFEEYRGSSISRKMYDLIETMYDITSTRTWSTNDAHIHILQKRGYNLHSRLIDDRAKGIDTVYFVRKN